MWREALALLGAEAQGRIQPCDRELAGILLGYLPAECTAITRIREPCVIFCRGNKNGKIYNKVIDP